MTGEAVVITDVGPRDGLQNQLKLLSIDERVQLIKAVAAAGVAQVEVGSFVSPKAVPASLYALSKSCFSGTNKLLSSVLARF